MEPEGYVSLAGLDDDHRRDIIETLGAYSDMLVNEYESNPVPRDNEDDYEFEDDDQHESYPAEVEADLRNIEVRRLARHRQQDQIRLEVLERIRDVFQPTRSAGSGLDALLQADGVFGPVSTTAVVRTTDSTGVQNLSNFGIRDIPETCDAFYEYKGAYIRYHGHNPTHGLISRDNLLSALSSRATRDLARVLDSTMIPYIGINMLVTREPGVFLLWSVEHGSSHVHVDLDSVDALRIAAFDFRNIRPVGGPIYPRTRCAVCDTNVTDINSTEHVGGGRICNNCKIIKPAAETPATALAPVMRRRISVRIPPEVTNVAKNT